MLKLTSLSSCAGCAAKLPQHALTEVLHDLPQFNNPNLLVGSAWGAIMRDYAERFDQSEHMLMKRAFIESEVNAFRQEHGLTPLVVCSRADDRDSARLLLEALGLLDDPEIKQHR